MGFGGGGVLEGGGSTLTHKKGASPWLAPWGAVCGRGSSRGSVMGEEQASLVNGCLLQVNQVTHDQAVVLQSALQSIPNPSSECMLRNVAIRLAQQVSDEVGAWPLKLWPPGAFWEGVLPLTLCSFRMNPCHQLGLAFPGPAHCSL